MTDGLKSAARRAVSIPLFFLYWLLIRFYRLTCRTEIVGDLEAVMNQPDPVLFTCRHQHLLFTCAHVAKYASRRPIAVLVSRSEDGDVAAGLLARFGFVPVRGSS